MYIWESVGRGRRSMLTTKIKHRLFSVTGVVLTLKIN
jgi:hypothetical protein